MDIESLRCIDKIIGSVKRVLLTRYCYDDMRLLFNEIAADFCKCYGDDAGDWIADDGCFDPIRFRAQIDAQACAALRNSSLTCNQYRAAYVTIPPSNSDK